MWDLYSILWVVPGFFFISIYNRRRPEGAINLSGWPYIFLIVVVASLTWIPSGLVIEFNFWSIKSLFIDKLGIHEQIVTLPIAILFSIFWLLCSQWKRVTNLVFPVIHDNFYKRCMEWENKAVILSLKNGKFYIGILWKYPEHPKLGYESQTISIIPLRSGYREQETKRVVWGTGYPYEEAYFKDMEVIIPRSEIITFGKFNIKVHQYFEKL